MSKKQRTEKPPASDDIASTPAKAAKTNASDPRKDGMRETVESVVIAFILAFLFRTFEAEAFVIPTGSMAPTLMGRNKDLACANCGFTYQVNASDEVDANTNQARPDRNNPKEDFSVTACTCPVCRYTMDLAPGNPEGEQYPSFKGDRILVTKFAYQFADPERYDVIVFKYPGEATTNFIKRLVGLPNETTQINHGNIWSRRADETEFQIARKPARKVPATLQMVYDNSVADDEGLVHDGWPQRWQADAGAAWKPGEDGVFLIESTPGNREDWLHYRHIVPTYDDWARFLDKQATPASMAPPPQLITDFTSYNTNYPPHPNYASYREDAEPENEVLGQHWVGDLAVECDLTTDSPTGEAVLELVEGGVRFQCRFDLATGQATLTIDGHTLAKGPTELRGGDEHRVRFSNIDDQLLVWVDDDLIEFDKPTAYNGPEADSLRANDEMPKRADLTPVGIAAKGAGLKVSNLRVLRDVYYIASSNSSALNDYWVHDLISLVRPQMPQSVLRSSRAAQLRYVMSTPELWQTLLTQRHALQFKLGPDQFVVLGDNSARSKDSRLWGDEGPDPDYPAPAYCVTRDLLIGKALFIYWPHSWDRTSRDGVWFPFFPNFARMGFVR